ncbi:hypothetical protein Hanom_Chr01g00032421 [Helianthus anomalus]
MFHKNNIIKKNKVRWRMNSDTHQIHDELDFEFWGTEAGSPTQLKLMLLLMEIV